MPGREELPPTLQRPPDPGQRMSPSVSSRAAAYEKFDRREDGYTKVLLHPANS
jgi:hypothetical protein